MLAPTGFFLSLHIRLFIAELQSGAELQIVRVGVGETIKSKGGMPQSCLFKSTSLTLGIHNMVN